MLSRQGTSKISGKKYATALPSFPKERLRHTFDKLLIPSIVTDFIVQFQWGILKSAKKSQKKPKFFLLELFSTKRCPHFPIRGYFFTFFTVARRPFPHPHDFQNCDGWNIRCCRKFSERSRRPKSAGRRYFSPINPEFRLLEHCCSGKSPPFRANRSKRTFSRRNK